MTQIFIWIKIYITYLIHIHIRGIEEPRTCVREPLRYAKQTKGLVLIVSDDTNFAGKIDGLCEVEFFGKRSVLMVREH